MSLGSQGQQARLIKHHQAPRPISNLTVGNSSPALVLAADKTMMEEPQGLHCFYIKIYYVLCF